MIDSANNEEDDTCIPRAVVYKMIKDRTDQIRVSGEAKELFVQCCNEFIHRLALQANTICEQQTKKLVHPDHIITALDNLGFNSYRKNCLNAMEIAREELANKRRKQLQGKLTSIYTDEELRQQQELLFQQAREEAQQLEEDDWTRTQELSKDIWKKKLETTRTDDDNYDN